MAGGARARTRYLAVALVALVVAVLLAGCGDGGAGASRRAGVGPARRPSTTATVPSSLPATTTTAAPVLGLTPLVIAPATHEAEYDRPNFTHWVDEDGDCQDARAEVLVAESRIPPVLDAAGCTVLTGEWLDPWSGVTTGTAGALDVDHTVPLANAWRSGAWGWTPEQRRAYANDLSFPDHLVAIPAGENRAKGDGGPEKWRPPDVGSWCRYASDWTAVKARWGLTATAEEWAALLGMVAAC